MKLKNHIDWIKNKSDILNSYQQSIHHHQAQPLHCRRRICSGGIILASRNIRLKKGSEIEEKDLRAPQLIFSHIPHYSKKLTHAFSSLSNLLRFPKVHFVSLAFFNGRKRQISRRRHRQEEHISEQQGRSPVPRRRYCPFPKNWQVR